MTSDVEHDDRSRSPSADESEASEAGESGDDHKMEGAHGQDKKGGPGPKKSSNAKDPSRPRRKKARRACYACQRAHLTCGDERPCQRCVKRGLQDSCQDGVRKKAKYLHDAPPEALLPGGANRYSYMNSNVQPAQASPQNPSYGATASSDLYSSRPATAAYGGFGPSPPSTTINLTDSIISPTFNSSQSPLTSQMPGTANMLAQALPPEGVVENENGMTGAGFDGNFFDAGELAQYDFDPTSFNFGNHYGALEFGMLGHMSSRAMANSPSGEASNPLNQMGGNSFATPNTMSTSNYADSPVDGSQPFLLGQEGLGDWRPAQTQSNVRQGSTNGLASGRRSRDGQNGFFDQDIPRAFSVGINSAVVSPTTGLSPDYSKASLPDGGRLRYAKSPGDPRAQDNSNVKQRPLPSQSVFNVAAARAFAPKRKRGDPSAIYTNVTQPYSYITGFHSLIQLLQKRFSAAKVLRIAKALGSIRPSFMSCTRNLGRDDLIFMEKCFQRTLWEYEDFINACGTPTVVCRRTGEIAAVGKEFCILTKWRKDVLLGREANLNINVGNADARSTEDSSGAMQSGTSSARAGTNTPRIPESMIDNSRPHPVSLAELMDADSVVSFYEDFARLAFGDSKGVVTARYKLLRYRTKEEEGRLLKRKRSAPASEVLRPGQISGEAGIDELGENDMVECSCCWTVKRDIFDLPMMIVMNFLPCI